MATQPSPPDAPAPAAAPEAPTPPTSTAGVYEYVDLTSRTYLFPGAPQTAQFGDVCRLPYDPGDGRWQLSKKKVTRLADNDPDQVPVTSQAQSAARLEVHAEAAKNQAAAAAAEPADGVTDTAKGA